MTVNLTREKISKSGSFSPIKRLESARRPNRVDSLLSIKKNSIPIFKVPKKSIQNITICAETFVLLMKKLTMYFYQLLPEIFLVSNFLSTFRHIIPNFFMIF